MATPLGNSVSYASNDYINGLVQGSKWSSGELTYSLWNTPSGIWDASSQSVIEQAFQPFENVANLEFVFAGSGGAFSDTFDLSFLLTGDSLSNYYGALASAVFPDPVYAAGLLEAQGLFGPSYGGAEGTILIDNYQSPFQYGTDPGGSGFEVLIHEIGHALGLKHPHDDGGNARPTFSQLGLDDFDNGLYTIMSYNSVPGASLTFGNAATLMPLDILAIQYIYGANMSYAAGDNVYYVADDGVVETIWDAGGMDLIDGRTSAVDLILDLQGGEWSRVGNTYSAIAYDVVIEDAYGGTGNDVLIGNYADNVLKGFNGRDSIYGGAGNDWINGNANEDVLYGEAGDDIVRGGKNVDSVDGGAGNDFINGNNGIDYAFGGDGNDTVHGGKENDIINGGNGDDFIYGDLGDDILEGGAGADVFVFKANSGLDLILDFVVGTDTLQISSTIFASASQAAAAFADNVLTLGDGNNIIISNVDSLSASDFVIV